MNPLQVRRDAAAGRFEADVQGGGAECAYLLQGKLMNITHTEVPRVSQGHGMAAALVQAALAQARAAAWKVRPSCSYVRAYMRRDASTRDLLEA
jgi:predicted GNAT family acetyltransferase